MSGVLESGDQSAAHAGGAGGLAVRGVTAETAPATPTGAEQDWLAQEGIAWEQRSAS